MTIHKTLFYSRDVRLRVILTGSILVPRAHLFLIAGGSFTGGKEFLVQRPHRLRGTGGSENENARPASTPLPLRRRKKSRPISIASYAGIHHVIGMQQKQSADLQTITAGRERCVCTTYQFNGDPATFCQRERKGLRCSSG